MQKTRKKEGYENGIKLLNEETQKIKELLEKDVKFDIKCYIFSICIYL